MTYENPDSGTVSLSAGNSAYLYSALDERVQKTALGTTTTFIPSGPGQILAENKGGTWTNYLWFNGELVGIQRAGTTYYSFNDHLGRPEQLRDSNQTVVWQSLSGAFSRSILQDNIGGLNIGFPGQYYDAESDLWQNGYRDYDARSGRYIETDPIGISGGINLYVYVAANPINNADPLGLEKWIWVSPIRDRMIFRGALADPDRQGMLTIYAHGGPDKINAPSFFSQYGAALDANQVAEIIRRSSWNGKDPIWLKSCNTGKNPNGFAQQLANLLGVTVYAPNVQVWFSNSGVIGPMPRIGGPVGPPDYSNPGQYTPFYPRAGNGP